MLTPIPSAIVPARNFVAPGTQNDPAQSAAPAATDTETTDRKTSAVTGRVAQNQNVHQDVLDRARRNAPATGPIFKLDTAQKAHLKAQAEELASNIKNLKSELVNKTTGKRPHVLGTAAIMIYWMTSPQRIVADIVNELNKPEPKTVYIRLLLEDLQDLMELAKTRIPTAISTNFGDEAGDVSERSDAVALLNMCLDANLKITNSEIPKYPSQEDYLHAENEFRKHGPVIKSDTLYHIKPKAESPVKTTLKLDDEEGGLQLEGQDNPMEVAPAETHRWTRTQTDCTNYVVKLVRDVKARKFSMTNEFKPVLRRDFHADANKVEIPNTGTTSTLPQPSDQRIEYSIDVPQRREIKLDRNQLIHTQDSEKEALRHLPDNEV